MNGYISVERAGNDALAFLPGDHQRLTRLAQLYGWDDREAIRDWSFPGDGVDDDVGILSAVQADRLASALEQALDDVPNQDARSHKLQPCAWAGPNAAEHGWLEEDESQPLSPLEWFSGDAKEMVRALAAFCRRGGFRVVKEGW